MDFKNFKERLVNEKKEIEEIIVSIKENVNIGNDRGESNDLSLIDNHPADGATEMFDREKSYALIDFKKEALRKIDDAILRIDNGNYGKCSICGKNIEEERLDFRPYTELCLNCEKEERKRAKPIERPVEEEVLTMPFGGNREEDSVIYDGEDAVEEVERVNKIKHNDEYQSIEGTVEPIENISNSYYKKSID